MFSVLSVLLRHVVHHGHLLVIDSAGTSARFGDGSGPAVIVRLLDRAIERDIAFDPDLALGEAYMQGRLIMERGSIYDLVALLFQESRTLALPYWARALEIARASWRRLSQHNSLLRSARNVEHHYDIDGRIYDLFLDHDRQYSCAYFRPGDDLESAQLAKEHHIAAKLDITPGDRVLDIGAGWGGLALYLASSCEADVTGITLSHEQLRVARQRAVNAGLMKKAHFHLQDYRSLSGRYDRIVSVGMFEHVGVGYYRAFFAKIRDLLEDDGVALISTIGRSGGAADTNPFIAKYIFPGGYIPALSEILLAVEGTGLIVTDVEVLRLHYAETLRAWRDRFLANRDQAVALKGEAFARMWEFYLAASEAAFRYQDLVVFHVQLTRRNDRLPLTRDYIQAGERSAPPSRRAPEIPRLAGE